MLHHLYRHALRQLVQSEFLLLPGVSPDLLLLDFLRQNEFDLVKEQGKLLLQLLLRQLLRGRPELLLLGQSDLLQKVVVALPQPCVLLLETLPVLCEFFILLFQFLYSSLHILDFHADSIP